MEFELRFGNERYCKIKYSENPEKGASIVVASGYTAVNGAQTIRSYLRRDTLAPRESNEIDKKIGGSKKR